MTVWNPLKKEFWETDNLLGRNKEVKTVEVDDGIPNDGWEHCPRCESNRVEQLGKTGLFLVMIGSGSCLLWVGILFLPLLIIAIPLMLLSPLAFLIPKMNRCKDCNHTWKAVKK